MGELTDTIKRLLDSLQVSSASPGHINVVLQTDPSIDLDEALQRTLQETGTNLTNPELLEPYQTTLYLKLYQHFHELVQMY